MNERIKALAVQAEQATKEHFNFDWDGTPRELFDMYFNEKFAELIVKECLDNMENCDGDVDFAIWKTQKDFGVE